MSRLTAGSGTAGGGGPRVVTLANPSAGQVGQTLTTIKSQPGMTTEEAASSFVSRILYPDLSLITTSGAPSGEVTTVSAPGSATLQSAQPQQVDIIKL